MVTAQLTTSTDTFQDQRLEKEADMSTAGKVAQRWTGTPIEPVSHSS